MRIFHKAIISIRICYVSVNVCYNSNLVGFFLLKNFLFTLALPLFDLFLQKSEHILVVWWSSSLTLVKIPWFLGMWYVGLFLFKVSDALPFVACELLQLLTLSKQFFLSFFYNYSSVPKKLDWQSLHFKKQNINCYHQKI